MRACGGILGLLAVLAACGGDDDVGSKPSDVAGGSAGAGGGDVSCQQIFDNSERQCPGGGFPLVSECEDDTREFESIGCEAWTRWMQCAGTGRFTCEGLFVDCESHWQGTQQCRATTAASGCVRLVDGDERCTEPTPYAFSCFGEPPHPDCVSMPTAAAVASFCCPALN